MPDEASVSFTPSASPESPLLQVGTPVLSVLRFTAAFQRRLGDYLQELGAQPDAGGAVRRLVDFNQSRVALYYLPTPVEGALPSAWLQFRVQKIFGPPEGLCLKLEAYFPALEKNHDALVYVPPGGGWTACLETALEPFKESLQEAFRVRAVEGSPAMGEKE